MKKLLSYLALFSSFGTLICCALPALLVALGLGAVVVGLVTSVPSLVWLSEHKTPLFVSAAALLTAAGWLQWRGRHIACASNVEKREACVATRDISLWIYGISVVLFIIGVFFAYIYPAATTTG